MRRGNRTALHICVVAAVAAAMTTSLETQGVFGAFWCYPAVVFAYFVLPTRVADVGSLALLALAGVLMNRYIGPAEAVRFVISLGLVMSIVTVMLKIRRDLQRKLAEQAITDPLTGAFNRRHMESCLGAAIERRKRTGEAASLLLFDVDRFKQINDELGHTAGDEVLKSLVALVAGRVRMLDVLFRIGGEEFVLLLPGARYAGAFGVAEDLRALVESAVLLDGRRISISVGVTELRSRQSAAGWIDAADQALSEAKRSGRNRVAGTRVAEAGVSRR